MTREAWVKKYGPLAISATSGTGIFPEVLLSQAIVESSKNGVPGESLLSKQFHNYHGLKVWPKFKGKSVNLKTREVYSGKDKYINSNFAVFDSVQDGFIGYVQFLQDNPRYAANGVFKAKNATEQIQALKRAGYATDPQYVTIVNSVAMKIKGWLSDITPEKGIAGIWGLLLIGTLFF